MQPFTCSDEGDDCLDAEDWAPLMAIATKTTSNKIIILPKKS